MAADLPIRPLLGPASIALLREALTPFTVDGVRERLGPNGAAAQQRADGAGVARALGGDDDRLATLIRLFLLGTPVPAAAARAALRPLDLRAAQPLVSVDGADAAAHVEIRPYGDAALVVSDFGSDVRPGPLAPDHVLGIGAASLLLAQATPRANVARGLDVGTGCGVQALHLSDHATSVVASDVSTRALHFAATTAALSGRTWDLRAGSLLEPVAAERFDTIVANPPFVVSAGLTPGTGGYDYRDSGLAGDQVSERLLRGVGDLLTEDGTASVLANWIVPSDGDWAGRVSAWCADPRCDAWVWQREVLDPPSYVRLWLRDAGESPDTPRWTARYNRWLDWFDRAGIAAVGMGLVTVWGGGTGHVVCEDVPQAVQQPIGAALPAWMRRQRWLRRTDDDDLLGTPLRCAEDTVFTRHEVLGPDGWRTELGQLRQAGGMRWQVEIDDALAGLVAACGGAVPLRLPVELLAAARDRPVDEVAAAVLPVVRDLVSRGFLEAP